MRSSYIHDASLYETEEHHRHSLRYILYGHGELCINRAYSSLSGQGTQFHKLPGGYFI